MDSMWTLVEVISCAYDEREAFFCTNIIRCDFISINWYIILHLMATTAQTVSSYVVK